MEKRKLHRTSDMTVAETISHMRDVFEKRIATAMLFEDGEEVVRSLRKNHESEIAAYLELPQHLTVAQALEERWKENRV